MTNEVRHLDLAAVVGQKKKPPQSRPRKQHKTRTIDTPATFYLPEVNQNTWSSSSLLVLSNTQSHNWTGCQRSTILVGLAAAVDGLLCHLQLEAGRGEASVVCFVCLGRFLVRMARLVRVRPFDAVNQSAGRA